MFDRFYRATRAADDARLGAGAVDRAAGRGPARRRGVGRPRARRVARCSCCVCRAGRPPEQAGPHDRAVASPAAARQAPSPDGRRRLPTDSPTRPERAWRTTTPSPHPRRPRRGPAPHGPTTRSARPSSRAPRRADPGRAATAEHDGASAGAVRSGPCRNPGAVRIRRRSEYRRPYGIRAVRTRSAVRAAAPTGSRRYGCVRAADRGAARRPVRHRGTRAVVAASGPSPPSAWSPRCSAAGSAATSGTSRHARRRPGRRPASSRSRCRPPTRTPHRSPGRGRRRPCAAQRRPAPGRRGPGGRRGLGHRARAPTGSCSRTTTSSRPRRTAAGSSPSSRTAPARPRRSSAATRARTSPCCGLRASPD